MIIGVSVGEGEGAHVNKIREKFQATELDGDSLQNKDCKVHAWTGNIVISVWYKS